MRKFSTALAVVVAAAGALSAGTARAATTTFDTGALIVPMDVDYQDAGMLKAFGLVDKLLRGGVPVQWVIKTPKVVVDAAKGKFENDFTATGKDFKTGTVVAAHGYRGGPFVIKAADAPRATPIITAWQASHTTAVHVTTAPFTGFISRTLQAAPRIAVFADGNQNIAFSYLNAAGIPDKNGVTWTAASPDVLTPAQVMGPTSTNHADGALFRPSGQPAFCEIMTMHWKVNEPEAAEVTAELSSFLKFPVHVNAECQAVNALEGAPPVDGRANFVSRKGFAWPAPDRPASVDFLNSALPFAQMDGPFQTIGGSEPAYALGPGSTYYDTGIVMVKGAGKAIGLQDVWMTGYANTGKGSCPITDVECIVDGQAIGKVSYLGGHAYDVKVPISTNPTTQGARLFLNSLYEAGCVTAEGGPNIRLEKVAPLETTTGTVTYIIDVFNLGTGPALDVKVTDALPAGSTFVSATKGGVAAAGTVTWTLGDLAGGGGTSVEVTLTFPGFGTFTNTANAQFTVGVSTMTAKSNVTTTTWLDCAGDAASSCACSDAATCADGGAISDATADASADGLMSEVAMTDSALASDSAMTTEDATSGLDSGAVADGSGDALGTDTVSDDGGALADASDDATLVSDSEGSDAATVPDGAGDDVSGATDAAAVADGAAFDPDAAAGATGGCGCGTAPSDKPIALLGAALAGLVVIARRRRAR